MKTKLWILFGLFTIINTANAVEVISPEDEALLQGLVEEDTKVVTTKKSTPTKVTTHPIVIKSKTKKDVI